MFDKCKIVDGCFLWQRPLNKGKYGRMRVKFPNFPSRMLYVHRLSYMLDNGLFELPKNSKVKHRCKNNHCVNPEHLFLEKEVSSDEFKIHHINKLMKHCERHSGCLIYKKRYGKHKYGRLRVKFPEKKSKKLHVHTFMYLLTNEIRQIPKGMDVSHLCHHHMCIMPSHLTLENHHTNMNRYWSCYRRGFCNKTHVPNCIM